MFLEHENIDFMLLVTEVLSFFSYISRNGDKNIIWLILVYIVILIAYKFLMILY